MSILAFVFAVAFGLVLVFVVVAAVRRGQRDQTGAVGWYSDGDASFTDSGPGADCGSGDGGGGCDGGGGGD